MAAPWARCRLAVVVALDGKLIGAGCNQPIKAVDPTAHAEDERSAPRPRLRSATTA